MAPFDVSRVKTGLPDDAAADSVKLIVVVVLSVFVIERTGMMAAVDCVNAELPKGKDAYAPLVVAVPSDKLFKVEAKYAELTIAVDILRKVGPDRTAVGNTVLLDTAEAVAKLTMPLPTANVERELAIGVIRSVEILVSDIIRNAVVKSGRNEVAV
jgi:hypothetical protein